MRCIAPAVAAQAPAGTIQRQRCASRRQTVLVAAAAKSSTNSSSNSNSSGSSKSALGSSIRLAAVRAAEQLREHPLFADSYSAALVEAATAEGAAVPAAADAAAAPDLQLEALATRFLDEQLLKAVTTVNMERDLAQEYNQVVLLGDAFDTRPFRLPWPEGTVIYCVAPVAAHQQADAAFKAQQARVPRGCLLRRVPAELHQDGGFATALERSGLRGDRLSVWVVQGISDLGLPPASLSTLLTDVCNLAAFDSLVTGLLPPMVRRDLDNLLASFGLLGAGVDFGPQTDWGRWDAALALDPAGLRPWLFVAQQKRLSLAEMGIYDDHVAAAEEVDEDFFGNFS